MNESILPGSSKERPGEFISVGNVGWTLSSGLNTLKSSRPWKPAEAVSAGLYLQDRLLAMKPRDRVYLMREIFMSFCPFCGQQTDGQVCKTCRQQLKTE